MDVKLVKQTTYFCTLPKIINNNLIYNFYLCRNLYLIIKVEEDVNSLFGCL